MIFAITSTVYYIMSILSIDKQNIIQLYIISYLQYNNSCFFTADSGVLVPDTGLDLADMGASHHQHTESGLTDTAADGEG